MKREKTVTLPSGREVKLKLPGPIKIGRMQRVMDTNNIDGLVEMFLAFLAAPTMVDEAALDEFLAEHPKDMAVLADECIAMLTEVGDEIGPLSKTATSA